MATGAKRPSQHPVVAANFSLWPHLASCPLWFLNRCTRSEDGLQTECSRDSDEMPSSFSSGNRRLPANFRQRSCQATNDKNVPDDQNICIIYCRNRRSSGMLRRRNLHGRRRARSLISNDSRKNMTDNSAIGITTPARRAISNSDRQKILQLEVPSTAEMNSLKNEERQRAITEAIRSVMPRLIAMRQEGASFAKIQRVFSTGRVEMTIQELRAAYEKLANSLPIGEAPPQGGQ